MSTPDAYPWRTTEHIAKEAMLLDETRAIEAQLYGKRLEMAMLNGMRESADHWRQCMEMVIRMRREAALELSGQRGECFFVAAGRYDGLALQGTSIGR